MPFRGHIREFTPEVSQDFILFASFSYCDEVLMKEGKCCPGLDKSFVLIATATLVRENYTYAIFRNDIRNK